MVLRTNPTIEKKEYLKNFLSQCQINHYRSRSNIITAEHRIDRLYYIIEGSVTVYAEDEDGREIIITYLNSGDFFGELGMFLGDFAGTRSALIRARVTVKLPRSPIHVLSNWLENNPIFCSTSVVRLPGVCKSLPAKSVTLHFWM